MKDNLRMIYENHHKILKKEGFSIMKEVRGDLIKKSIGTGKRVLDIGCRDGSLTSYFIDGNDVTGVDIDAHSLELAKNKFGINTIMMDLNGDWSELNENKYDVIFAGEVLEHLYYPEEVFKKINYHLNPDGMFIGTVPNAFSLKNRIRYLFGHKKSTPLADPTHINQFSLRDLKMILKNNFSTTEIIGLGRYSWLSKKVPSLISFILMFKCQK